MSFDGLMKSFSHFGFSIPLPAIGHTFAGFEYLGLLIVTAIPFGVYDLVEALDNVESAAAAGDKYATRRILLTDGVVSLIGGLMGNPFNLNVYIGHPGWKAMGGRCGYAFATGIMALVLCWLGLVAVFLAAIPVVAILPILLYIGMLIGSQAFQETPLRHAPAIILGIMPHLAHWAEGMVRNGLSAAGINDITPELAAKLEGKGVLLEALTVFGNGSALSGIVFAASTVFIIERQLWRAAAFAAAGAAFTACGLMHGERVGFTEHPALAASYLLVAVFLGGCAKFARVTPLDPAPAPAHAG
jgi:AGZA family xanthine/uracil permease-like MFS transporter